MASFSPVIVASAPSRSNSGSFDNYARVRLPAGFPQLNTIEDEYVEWKRLTSDIPYRTAQICFPTRENTSKKALRATPSPPTSGVFDPRHQYIPETDPSDDCRWKKCQLLSLPKELRLEIYKYALTDPSIPDLLVGIKREPTSPCYSPRYKRARPPTPDLRFYHHVKRTVPISTNLLLTNRFIYEEALPVLYANAKFYPHDLEGLLPLFFNTLSPYAQSCIRNIHLSLPTDALNRDIWGDRSKPFFHWAVTCAQVARLNKTLRQVDIEGEWSDFDKKSNRRSILYPLCKIKAKKKFVPNSITPAGGADHDAQFEELLIQATSELKASSKRRKEVTKADALERAKRDEQREAEERSEREKRETVYNRWTGPLPSVSLPLRSGFPKNDKILSEDQVRHGLEHRRQGDAAVAAGEISPMEDWCRWAEENIKRMESDLSSVPGIKQFEKELEEYTKAEGNNGNDDDIPSYEDLIAEDWDFVSMGSGVSTPRARTSITSLIDKRHDEDWVDDIASTLIGKDDVVKGDESDAESETWEHVDK